MWKINPENQLTRIGDGKSSDIVWVPSETAVFYRAELPLNQKKIWAQTVGFMLEDKIIELVDDLHFAIGVPDNQEGIPVATLPIGKIEEWLTLLKDKRIKATYIWLDFLAIPFDNAGDYDAVLWHEQGRCILRLGEQECVTGTLEWLFSLTRIMSEINRVQVYSDNIPDLPEAWREEALDLPCSLEECMIGIGKRRLPVNLMQGSICPESAMSVWFSPWYATAVTLLFLAGTYLVGLGFETRSLNAHATVLGKVTEKTFLENFPNQKQIFDVRLQVSRLLSGADSGGRKTKNRLWQIIKTLDPIMNACKPCRMESIKLRSASIVLTLSSSAKLNPVIEKIKRLPGITVKTEKMANKGKREQTRLELALKPDAS